MVTYYIQQHLLSAKVRTIIKDDNGKPIFLLVGSWGTRGDSISIYTLEGELLASAKQTTLSFRSRFELYEKHEKVGNLSCLFSINRDVYFVKKRYWLVWADIKNQHYRIYYLNQKIMEMSKETNYKGDYFKIQINDEENAPLCFCIAAVLDYWARRNNKIKNKQTGEYIQIQI